MGSQRVRHDWLTSLSLYSKTGRNRKTICSCFLNPDPLNHFKHFRSLMYNLQFSSVQSFSRVRLFVTLRIAARQASLSITIPRVQPNPCPLSWRCHPAVLSSVVPSPPAPNLSQHQGRFQWVSSSHEVVKVLEFQLQHQSFQQTPRTDLL